MVALIFFFQAEDGIRDVAVTGVQTCALPISSRGAIEQGVGHAAHRRYDHDLWGRTMSDHDLRGTCYPGRVRERRAAELVDVRGRAGGAGGAGHQSVSKPPAGRAAGNGWALVARAPPARTMASPPA